MPTKTKTPEHHKKIHGKHHRHSKRYVKVYWPYAPIALIIALGLFIGNWQPQTRNGVLAYATEMSIDTLLSSTNEQRTKNSESTLKLNAQLTAAAQAKANDMTARDYWAHTTPDGKEPWTFVQGAGYAYQKAGENLAYGFNSSKDTVVGWMNSPSHRENMLDTSYTEVGFGFANARDFNGSGPETVVVAMYGLPQGAPTPETADAHNLTLVNTTKPLSAEPKTLGVTRLGILTGGSLPWATFAVGLIIGLGAAVVILKHSLAFKRLLIHGEEFIIHHPWLDIAMVTIVMVGYVLIQSTGAIK